MASKPRKTAEFAQSSNKKATATVTATARYESLGNFKCFWKSLFYIQDFVCFQEIYSDPEQLKLLVVTSNCYPIIHYNDGFKCFCECLL